MSARKQYAPDSEYYKFVNLSMAAYLLIQLIFLALGIFLGCAMKRYKRAGSLAVTIILATYFASVLAGMSKDMEWLKYISPFKYFDAAQMLRDGSLDVLYVLLSLAIVAVFISAGYVVYKRRDLYI